MAGNIDICISWLPSCSCPKFFTAHLLGVQKRRQKYKIKREPKMYLPKGGNGLRANFRTTGVASIIEHECF